LGALVTAVWLAGLIVGLGLGVPLGLLLAFYLGSVDRWLDGRWRS
jgi:hypothetical protein